MPTFALRQHAFLVSQLTRRYRGSYLGIVWSFIKPVDHPEKGWADFALMRQRRDQGGALMRLLPLTAILGSLVHLLYASAVFYPLSWVPAPSRAVLRYNPLVFRCEQSRNFAAFADMV